MVMGDAGMGERGTIDAGAATPRRRFFGAGAGVLARPAILAIAAMLGAAGIFDGLDARALAGIGGDVGGRSGLGVAAVLWALSLVLVGMPHGAYDAEPLRRAFFGRGDGGSGAHGRMGLVRACALFFAYCAPIVAACALFVVVPAPLLIAFLLLSAHHFGLSDSVHARGAVAVDGAHGGRSSRRVFGMMEHVYGFGRGLVVIFAAFAFQPVASWLPFREIVAATRGDAAAHIGSAATIGWVGGSLVAIGLFAVIAGSAKLASTGRWRDLAEELGTCAAMIALAALVSPLLAIGVYFVAVHAAGHCLRADLPGRPVDRPGVMNAVRVHGASMFFLVPAIAAVLASAAWVFGGLDAWSVTLAFILFCAVATLPHHLMWLGVGGRWFGWSGLPGGGAGLRL